MAELIEWLIAGRSSGGSSAAVVAMVAAAVVVAESTATATAAMGAGVYDGLSTYETCFTHIHTALFLFF